MNQFVLHLLFQCDLYQPKSSARRRFQHHPFLKLAYTYFGVVWYEFPFAAPLSPFRCTAHGSTGNFYRRNMRFPARARCGYAYTNALLHPPSMPAVAGTPPYAAFATMLFTAFAAIAESRVRRILVVAGTCQQNITYLVLPGDVTAKPLSTIAK